jgi:hypothetical protein
VAKVASVPASLALPEIFNFCCASAIDLSIISFAFTSPSLIILSASSLLVNNAFSAFDLYSAKT